METLLIIAIIAGIIGGAVIMGLIVWIVKSISSMFTPKKTTVKKAFVAPKKEVSPEEKAAKDAVREAELDDELSKKYKNGCDIAVGDVTAYVKNFKFEWLTHNGIAVRYDNLAEFIKFEGDLHQRITEYEIRMLQNINALCKKYAGSTEPTILIGEDGHPVNEAKVREEGVTAEPRPAHREIIATDFYGDIYVYAPDQYIDFGANNRMKARLDGVYYSETEELPHIFIREIHTCRGGFGSSAPTRFRLTNEDGVTNEDHLAMFFDRIESVGTVHGSVWSTELQDYYKLQERINHYNKHRHLLVWDEDIEEWTVEPTPAPKVEKAPVKEPVVVAVEEPPAKRIVQAPVKEEPKKDVFNDLLTQLPKEEREAFDQFLLHQRAKREEEVIALESKEEAGVTLSRPKRRIVRN